MANGAGGGLFRAVLGVVAVGLIGYNTWEITRLRTEVGVLKRKNDRLSATAARPVKPVAGAPTTPSAEKTIALFGEARRHAERAEALLRKKKYDEARREIALVTQSARSANAGARAETEDAMRGLESALRRLSKDAGRLWERNNSVGAKDGKTSLTLRDKGVRSEVKNDKKP